MKILSVFRNGFSKTAWEFLERIAEYESIELANKTICQCIQTKSIPIRFIEVIKVSRKIRPL